MQATLLGHQLTVQTDNDAELRSMKSGRNVSILSLSARMILMDHCIERCQPKKQTRQ
jgi:hypothetical protein